MGCPVSARASPPSVRMMKICRVRSPPSPVERRNATQRPSGDQRAPESPSSPVKRRASVPSAFTIQSEVVRSFSSQSSSERENSTRSPSGRHAWVGYAREVDGVVNAEGRLLRCGGGAREGEGDGQKRESGDSMRAFAEPG